jgi:hypothetical protein
MDLTDKVSDFLQNLKDILSWFKFPLRRIIAWMKHEVLLGSIIPGEQEIKGRW